VHKLPEKLEMATAHILSGINLAVLA